MLIRKLSDARVSGRKRRSATAIATVLGLGLAAAGASAGVVVASPALATASVSRPTTGVIPQPPNAGIAVVPGDAPAVVVTPSSGLDPTGDSVHIAGSGFLPAEPGIYVVFGPGDLSQPWQEDPGTFPSAVWVHPGGAGGAQQAELRPDGSFDTDLSVAAIAGAQTHGIYTFAAHGSPDRTQDTTTVITFAEGPTSTPTSPPTSVPPTTGPPATDPPTTIRPTNGESATPPLVPPTGGFAEGEVSSGLLDWGVKESFRSYVSGPIARGGWTVHGITDNGGTFRWASSYGTYDMETRRGTVSFDGGVTFSGHEGALDLTLSRPQVRFVGDATATLLLDVRSKTLGGDGETVQAAVEFATLDLSAASAEASVTTVILVGIPATLTDAGAAGFGGFYQAGAALDPLTLRFAVGGAEVPGGGSAALAHTGSTGAGLAVGGAVLVALGAGLVLLGRRRLARA